MSMSTITENASTIKVWRVGHHYYRNWVSRGNVLAHNEHISWQAAYEFITQHNGGVLPQECNLDVCHARYWTWQL